MSASATVISRRCLATFVGAIVVAHGLMGCGGPSPEEYLATFFRQTDALDDGVSAAQLAASGDSIAQHRGVCEETSSEDFAELYLVLDEEDAGGGLWLPDLDGQLWQYGLFWCQLEGVKSLGVVELRILRNADATWTLTYSGTMKTGDQSGCTLSATATANSAGELTGPIEGMLCDRPVGEVLAELGVQLMVPDFAY